MRRYDNNVGRTGRNRTRNPRFWRPVLYQLNYCPATSINQRLALFVICVFPAGGAELLQLHSVRMLALVAGRSIITIFAIFAGKDDYISHRSLPVISLSVDYAGNYSATDGVATFADSETKTLLHGNRGDEFGCDFHIVTRHNHFDAFGQYQ